MKKHRPRPKKPSAKKPRRQHEPGVLAVRRRRRVMREPVLGGVALDMRNFPSPVTADDLERIDAAAVKRERKAQKL